MHRLMLWNKPILLNLKFLQLLPIARDMTQNARIVLPELVVKLLPKLLALLRLMLSLMKSLMLSLMLPRRDPSLLPMVPSLPRRDPLLELRLKLSLMKSLMLRKPTRDPSLPRKPRMPSLLPIRPSLPRKPRMPSLLPIMQSLPRMPRMPSLLMTRNLRRLLLRLMLRLKGRVKEIEEISAGKRTRIAGRRLPLLEKLKGYSESAPSQLQPK